MILSIYVENLINPDKKVTYSLIHFAVFYDTILYIWIAPTKIQKMRVPGKKLWILWHIEEKNYEILVR